MTHCSVANSSVREETLEYDELAGRRKDLMDCARGKL